MFLSILLQLPDFQFDRNSFILGIVAGIVLTIVFIKILPFIKRVIARVRGWINAKLVWMRSGVEERFQNETAEFTEQLHMGKQWAKLTDVFVQPRLVAPNPDPGMLLEDRGATHFATLWPELAAKVGAPVPPSMAVETLLRNGRRVLITGQVGSGKSTLLAYLANRIATATPDGEMAAFEPFVPVLLHVSELDLQYKDDVQPEDGAEVEPDEEAVAKAVLSPIVKALQQRSSPITSPGIGDMLDRKLADGHILLFLDGWDALPVQEQPSVREWLGEVIKTYRNMRVLMTANVEGYGSLLEMNFTVTSILPWRVGQVREMAAKWQAIFPQEEETEFHLEDVWQPGQSVWETAVRLWLLLAKDGEKPQSHVDLVKAAIPLFTNPKRKVDEPWVEPSEDVVAFWEDLSFIMMERPSSTLTTHEIRQLSEPPAPEDEEESVDKSIGSRLRKSLSQNGLFVKYGNQFGFQSTIWRDYLAGCYMAKEGLTEEAAKYVTDPDWRGVIDVYVTFNGASELALPLLQKRQESVTQEPLFRVATWMPLATDGGEWRRQTMIALGQMLRMEDMTPVLRLRAMAAMTLTGEDGVITFLTKLLERSDPFLRQMATMALPAIDDNQIVGMLSKMLEDGDTIVVETAVNSLMLIQHNPLTERPILMALIGENEEAGLLAAELLALSGDPGIEILREAVEDDDVQVRRAALHGLQQVDADWLEAVLVKVEREDDEWFVRSAANGALAAMRKRQEEAPWFPVNVAEIDWVANFALNQGYEVPRGAGAVPVLLQIMKESESSRWRASSALLLCVLPSQGAKPYLQTAVRDEDPLVRDASFVALVQNGRAYQS